jgi:small subunit ribosomal protein S1
LDIDKRRLKLGIKQLEPDSMDDFIAEAKPGDPLTGRVLSVKGRRAVVEVGEGVKAVCQLPEAKEAAAPAAEPAKDVSSLSAMLSAAWKGGGAAGANKKDSGPKAGEVLSFKITKIDSASREIELELA